MTLLEELKEQREASKYIDVRYNIDRIIAALEAADAMALYISNGQPNEQEEELLTAYTKATNPKP